MFRALGAYRTGAPVLVRGVEFNERRKSGEAMKAETKLQKGLRERTLVDVAHPHDAKYWTGQFGATVEEIRAAIKAVGRGISVVAAHIDTHQDVLVRRLAGRPS